MSDMPLNTGDNSVNAIAAAIAHPSIEQMNHKSVSRQGKRLVIYIYKKKLLQLKLDSVLFNCVGNILEPYLKKVLILAMKNIWSLSIKDAPTRSRERPFRSFSQLRVRFYLNILTNFLVRVLI